MRIKRRLIYINNTLNVKQNMPIIYINNMKIIIKININCTSFPYHRVTENKTYIINKTLSMVSTNYLSILDRANKDMVDDAELALTHI